MVLAFMATPNSALAVSRSLAEPMGSPPVRWTVTFQSQTPGMRSRAKRMRPMPVLAFEHRIVAKADRAELQHFSCVPETTTPLRPNMLARRHWFTH